MAEKKVCKKCYGKGVYYEPMIHGMEVCTRCDAFDEKYAEQKAKRANV